MRLPEFTDEQCKELRTLGVHSEQIEQLRIALYEISACLIQPAASASVRKHLDEVERLASTLAKKLAHLSQPKNVAQQTAHNLLQRGYWERRAGDHGPTTAHVLVPPLDALADAAREANAEFPSRKSGRPATVSARSIRVIDGALRLGWSKHWQAQGTFAPTYPHKRNNSLLPSASPTSRFMRICQTCYAAVGHDNANLERPVKTYIQMRKRQSARDRAAFMQGVKSTRDKTPRK
jgi:hypothetical protein